MYSEFEFENIDDQNSNCLRQNFVITWEQEIRNCFLDNLLLGNVLVIVHLRLNFCSVLNAFIESLKCFITSLERSNDSVQGFNPDLQTEG